MANDLIIRFLGDTSEFNAKLEQTEAKLSAFGHNAEKAGTDLTTKFAAVGIAAVAAVGVASLELADKFDVVHERLETVTKSVGQNFDDFKGKVDETDRKMANLGFSAIDVQDSLGSLTAATHDLGKATELEGLAADIARFKHESLADATKTLVAIEAGRLKGLAAFGISTKDAEGKTISLTTALQKLSGVTHDQATAYTHTLAGEFDVLKANVTNAGIAIGEKLMPWVNHLVDGIAGGISGFEKFNDATGGFAGKIAAVAAVAPFAIAGLIKLVELAGAASAALVSAGESLYIWALLNPELAALAGAAAVAGGAFAIFGHHAHEAAVAVSELDNLQLDEQMASIKEQLQQLADSPWADKVAHGWDPAMEGFNQALKDGLPQAQRWIDAMARAGLNTDQERSALAKRVLAQKETDAAQQKLNGTTQTATALTKEQIDAQKKLTDSLAKYGAVAGPTAEAIAKALDIPKAALDDLTQKTKDFNSSIQNAFTSAGDTVDAWSQKSKFDLASFESDLLADTIAQANWSRNIAILSDAGINQGFLKTLIAAGPKSAKVVQGLVDGVTKGSVTSINAIEKFAGAAVTTAQSHVDAEILGLKGSFDDFARYIESLNPHLIVSITGQIYGGGSVSSGGGGRIHALGGPTQAGQTYWVGERGPELWTADRDGAIVPNANIRPVSSADGGGVTIINQISLAGAIVSDARGAVDLVTRGLESQHGKQRLRTALGV